MVTVNGKITRPISVADVKRVIGSSSNDVGMLCKSNNINKWSKYKPVKYQGLLTPASKALWQQLRWGLEVPTCTLKTTGTSLATKSSIWEYVKPAGGSVSPYRLADFENYCHNAPVFVKTSELPDRITNAFFDVMYYINQEESNGGLVPSDVVITNVTATSVKDLYVGFALYRDPDIFDDGNMVYLITTQTAIGDATTKTLTSIQVADLPAGSYYAMMFLSPYSYTYGTALPTTLPSTEVVIIEGGIKKVTLDTSDMNIGIVLWGRGVVNVSTGYNTDYYSLVSGSVVQDDDKRWKVAFSPTGGLSLTAKVANLEELDDLRRRITVEPIKGSYGFAQYNPMVDKREVGSLTIGLVKFYTNFYTDGLMFGLRYILDSKTQNAQTKVYSYKWKRYIVVLDMSDGSIANNAYGNLYLGTKFDCICETTEDGTVVSFECAEIELLRIANITTGIKGDSQTLKGVHVRIRGNRNGTDFDEINHQIYDGNIAIPSSEDIVFNPYTDLQGFYGMPYGDAYVEVTVDTIDS